MPRATILVVDQDHASRQMVCDVLAGDSGYEITAVASTFEARQGLNVGSVAVLITAVDPAGGELELLRQALTLPDPPDVILTTVSAALPAALRGLEQGARDYLLKPCDPARLRQLIRNCLERRRLAAEVRRLQTQVHLYQAGRQLSSQLDIEVLLSEAAATLRAELGGNVRSLAFLASQGQISHLVSTGLPDDQARSLATSLLPRLAADSRGHLLDGMSLLLPESTATDLSSLWFFPLQGESGMLGALALINSAGRGFPAPFPHDSLAFLAEQASLGFQNACRYLRAREMVYTDDLTELFNHRYLQIALQQEVRRAERYTLQFTVAFIDIDQFKVVNDTYGHMVGSNMLREVGRILRQCVRNADLLFRYGGDEFTALLLETDSSGGKVVAERIRKAIADHPFDAGQGTTHRLTATVGYATYPIHATSRQELIDLSDRAMYQGKRVRNVSCGAGEIDSAASGPDAAPGVDAAMRNR